MTPAPPGGMPSCLVETVFHGKEPRPSVVYLQPTIFAIFNYQRFLVDVLAQRKLSKFNVRIVIALHQTSLLNEKFFIIITGTPSAIDLWRHKI